MAENESRIASHMNVTSKLNDLHVDKITASRATFTG